MTKSQIQERLAAAEKVVEEARHVLSFCEAAYGHNSLSVADKKIQELIAEYDAVQARTENSA